MSAEVPNQEEDEDDDTAVENGTFTLACGYPAATAVTASANDGNVPANTVDGNLATRWSCLGKGCWIRYDLGAQLNMCGTEIAWYNGASRKSNFVVSVSADGTAFTNVFTGTSSGTTTALETMPFSATGRYVKITVNGNTVNDWASITEVKLSGTAADQPPPPPPPPPPPGGVDEDGVVMLHPANTSGSSFRLGSQPLTGAVGLTGLENDVVTAGTDGAIKFWTTQGHPVSYSSGNGTTVRLDMKASGGSQTYTWKNGAITSGFIGNNKDLKNMEITAYVRVRQNLGVHTEFNVKVRGGRHTGSGDARASCVEMGLPYSNYQARASRELDHPRYDMISIPSKFNYKVTAGQWVGVKMVSFINADKKSTTNRIYVDAVPFDAQGKPRNQFLLYSEWKDEDGKSTGRYTQAALWGGWIQTLRIDGWRYTDVAILSAREIIPPI
jgi:hypothetical protein